MDVARSAVLFLVLVAVSGSVGIFVSNLNPICLRCLCHAASSCNLTIGCIDGFCGPFQINRLYWRDAGHYVPPEDDASREGAFLDCAMDYTCAQHIIEEYFIRYGTDCNRDGVTDCDDYAMLHFHLKEDCRSSLDGTNFGRRYSTCRPTSEPPGSVRHPPSRRPSQVSRASVLFPKGIPSGRY